MPFLTHKPITGHVGTVLPDADQPISTRRSALQGALHNVGTVFRLEGTNPICINYLWARCPQMCMLLIIINPKSKTEQKVECRLSGDVTGILM